MYRALVYKELRETGWIALIGLAAYFACAGNLAGHAILPFLPSRVPFLPFIQEGFIGYFCIVSIGLSVGLGLAQTVMESRRGTWLFLLHRPLSRRRIIAVKLAVGGGLYLACSATAILGYAIWAATPGTHAGPFEWWMTAEAWTAWAAITVLYLGAFLAGVRPGRWFFDRLFPLAATGILALLLAIPPLPFLLRAAALALVAACLLVLIDFAARTRDFS